MNVFNSPCESKRLRTPAPTGDWSSYGSEDHRGHTSLCWDMAANNWTANRYIGIVVN